MSLFRNFRENINLKLYSSKKRADKIYENWSFFMVFAGVFSFLEYHGFPNNNSFTNFFSYSFGSLLIIQIIKFVFGYIYSFNPKEYFTLNRIELFVLSIAVLHSVLFFVGIRIDFIHDLIAHNGDDVIEFTFFTQLYFAVIFFIEIARVSMRIPKINLSPPALLVSSFAALILGGALLLMLPNMTTMEGSMPFFDALFTSTSASCVTGLIVVDTATYFSAKGQFVLMMLIQLGGLNIIAFALLFALISKRRIGIKHQTLIKENFDIGNIQESKTILRKVFAFSFSIEIIGAIVLFFSWKNDGIFTHLGEKLFNSIFHSVSAFNNAGFSTFTNGLGENILSDHILLQLTIVFLIVMGSTGFTVIHEVIRLSKLKTLLSGGKIRLSLNTKIGLITPLLLIVIGTIAFLILEKDNTLNQMGTIERISNSVFQSVTTRTAGFNTVDIGQIGIPMLLIMMLMMYIGANPVSTGGGVKTNTIALLFISTFATIRGRKNIEIDKKQISYKALNKALIVLIFSISIIFISTILLSISDPDKKIIDLFFEEISAFATVGLTRGITSELSDFGKLVIMTSMFLGRIGLLTLVYSLGIPSDSSKYEYPKAKVIIG
jgi:potassium uptake TrkH family protein